MRSFDEPVLSAVEGLRMSEEMHAAQRFPLTLSVSKGERKAAFNGLFTPVPRGQGSRHTGIRPTGPTCYKQRPMMEERVTW